MPLKKICTYCKKEYLVIPSKRYTSRYCSRICFNNSLKGKVTWNKGLIKESDSRVEKSGETLKKYYITNKSPKCGFKKGHKMHLGKKLTEKHKKKIGLGVKSSPKYQKGIRSKERSLKLSKALKGRTFSEEWRRKQFLIHRIMWQGDKNPSKRPEVRKKIAESRIGKPCSKELKEKLSKHWKKKWKEDKAFIQKWIKSQNLRPNKKEKFLINLFKDHDLPFKYVGDFKLMVGGRCPDFIDKSNKKKIIEFFGNHWHTADEEKERIEHFKEYGFDCLIIWQNELKNEDQLLNKIKTFNQKP